MGGLYVMAGVNERRPGLGAVLDWECEGREDFISFLQTSNKASVHIILFYNNISPFVSPKFGQRATLLTATLGMLVSLFLLIFH